MVKSHGLRIEVNESLVVFLVHPFREEGGVVMLRVGGCTVQTIQALCVLPVYLVKDTILIKITTGDIISKTL